MTLEVLPVLAGFFTYKVGVVGSSSVALFRQLSSKANSELVCSRGSGDGAS
jgi:hypothetical protein